MLAHSGCDLNQGTLDGRVTPLMMASKMHCATAMESLLEARADVLLQTPTGASPIIMM